MHWSLFLDFEHAVFTREKLVKQLNHTTEATVENK